MKREILENMMDAVIRKYGFEATETIAFCRLVETEDKIFSAKIEAKFKRLMEA